MKTFTKEEILKAYKGDAKQLAKKLKISLSKAYSLIKENGLGQNKEEDKAKIEALLKEAKTPKEVSKLLNLSISRVYARLKQYGLSFEKEVKYPISKEKLEELYANNSGNTIADMYGVSRQTIYNWLSSYGITVKPKGKGKTKNLLTIPKDVLIELYKDKSVEEIAQHFNLKVSRVNYLFKNYEIARKAGPRVKLLPEVVAKELETLSYKEVALKYGVHPISILRKAKQAGISRKKIVSISKEFCEENKHRLTREIAQELNCSVATVNIYMKRYGFSKIKRVHLTSQHIEEYKQGKITSKQLAEIYECTVYTIRQHLKGK